MPVRYRHRSAEQGQALILALALLGLLSVFSVAVLKLASISVVTEGSARQAAYRDGLGESGGLMARQVVAGGLGCTSTPMTAQLKAETITVTVAQVTLTQDPGPCAFPNASGPTKGAALGDYVLCTTTSASTGTYEAVVTVSSRPIATDPGHYSIDIVHFSYGHDPRC